MLKGNKYISQLFLFCYLKIKHVNCICITYHYRSHTFQLAECSAEQQLCVQIEPEALDMLRQYSNHRFKTVVSNRWSVSASEVTRWSGSKYNKVEKHYYYFLKRCYLNEVNRMYPMIFRCLIKISQKFKTIIIRI